VLLMRGRDLLDWLLEPMTSRPSGPIGRALYRDATSLHGRAWQSAHERLELRTTDRLLDVGCGGGTFLNQALESVASAAGLDHSPDMIEVARANNAAAVADDRLDLRVGDAGALPWDDGTFDVVTNLAAIDAMQRPDAVLRETARVLVSGGRCLVATMARPEGDDAGARLMRWLMPRLYREAELAELLAGAGFGEIETRTTDDGWLVGYAVKG
jgi:ubiquinone/menaquinone biosynthesis C-methylase UbiE